jgi:transposase-like protein
MDDSEQGSKPKYRNEEWLREKYIKEGKTTREIADELDVVHSTVATWLNNHDIEATQGRAAPSDSRLSDGEWLREQYVGERKTIQDIAEECDCSLDTARRKLISHGIETRPSGGGLVGNIPDERIAEEEWLREQYVDKKKSMADIGEQCGCHKHTVRRWLHKHNIKIPEGGYQTPADERLTDPDWLHEQYAKSEKSLSEIADEIGCSLSAVWRWLDQHEIDTREPSSNDGLSGEDHAQWKGGKFPYGPGWTEQKRCAVRERDNYCCQDPNCAVTQEQHFDEYGERLHVHHLHKARNIDDPEDRNAKENLITLCRGCHARWEKMADAGLVPEVVRND